MNAFEKFCKYLAGGYSDEVKTLRLKIETDTYRMRQIIESCQTKEQIKNANRLACFLVEKWVSLKKDMDLSCSYRYIWPMITSASHDMERFLNEAKERISGDVDQNEGDKGE